MEHEDNYALGQNQSEQDNNHIRDNPNDSTRSPHNTSTNAEPTTTSTDSAAARQQHTNDYWCHQCQREITPMMVPDPMCPHCHNEFVEKIEADNDPRTFIQPEPATAGGAGGDRSGSQEGPGFTESINLNDLFQLFQAIATPQRASQQQQSPFQGQQGPVYSSGTQIIFNTGPMGTTTRTPSSGSQSQQQQQQQQQHEDSHPISTRDGQEGQQEPQRQQQQQQQPGPQWHSPPSFISGLLNRLGIEVHYTTDPAALQGSPGFGGGVFGGPMGGGGGGFFPIAGNPGDYAWGQGGLDDIISQMMELQNRQHGPVGATDEIIDNIPHHKLTDEELEAKTECSVCKDEFAKEDNLLQLPCKHIFHEDCIKPWLKVSGTCPTCRFSLVSGSDERHAEGHQSPSGNSSATSAPSAAGGGNGTETGARSFMDLPGAFPTERNDNNDSNSNSNSNSNSGNRSTTTSNNRNSGTNTGYNTQNANDASLPAIEPLD
ncbi:hypothetical protein BC939DRAFT_469498 [Gamsiella multidivaricata]|uniref:uncharacterized protein n=1 Tax=Gamsiella multidivaricata TaxID=101098 RepID=UPI00221FEBD5|nr:uncharacterized protein BC939DRAFT_469498 [Gamsiella multidivaricata]KAI7816324.1 hypothetical protein BC939DRAFT_469498 [Gamsiella multidivaricata]